MMTEAVPAPMSCVEQIPETIKQQTYSVMIHSKAHRVIAEYYLKFLCRGNLIIINSKTGYFFNSSSVLWELLESFAIGTRICEALIEDAKHYVEKMQKFIDDNISNKQNDILKLIEVFKLQILCSQAFIKVVQNTNETEKIVKMVCGLKSDSGIERMMDIHPDTKYMLPTPNNRVIDLKTGWLHHRTKEMCFTKTIPLEYVQEVYEDETYDQLPSKEREECDKYRQAFVELQKAMEDIALNMPDRIKYNQKLLGLYLTGETKDKIISIFYGPIGDNGKSVDAKLLKKVMGPFCAEVSDGVVLAGAKSSANSHTGHLTSLIGIRLATYKEIPAKAKISTKSLKQASGDDSIYIREPYGKGGFEVFTQAKVVLFLNQQPNVPDADQPFWNRLRYIKFDAKFVDDPKAPNDRKKNTDVIDVWPDNRYYQHAFLHYCVQGAIKYYEEGLGTAPQDYLEIKESLRDNSNKYLDFIRENIEWHAVDPNLSEKGKNLWDDEHKVQSSELWKTFKEWIKEKDGFNSKCGLQSTFNEQIITHGHPFGVYQRKKDDRVHFHRIMLKS